MLTPRQFVDDLKVLEMGGVGSKALPNGLSEASTPPRPAQEIYDQKYFTRDAPPPQRAPPLTPQPSSGSRRFKLSRPSPTSASSSTFEGSSISSATTNYSNSGTVGEEKKKKRGFLRF